MKSQSTSVRISQSTLKLLIRRAADLQQKRGERVTYDTLLRELLATDDKQNEREPEHA